MTAADDSGSAVTVGEETPAEAVQGLSPLRVLVVAVVGAVLLGGAAFAASTVVHSDEPIVRTMCVDSTCTYPMSAEGASATPPPAAHKQRSAPERLVQKVLYFCHIR